LRGLWDARRGEDELVLRFALIVSAQLLYSHVFWMSAVNTDELIEGMTRILVIVVHPDPTQSEQDAMLTAVRLWLERIDGIRWLLILDNVDMSVL
jgi:hypothetical protein